MINLLTFILTKGIMLYGTHFCKSKIKNQNETVKEKKEEENF